MSGIPRFPIRGKRFSSMLLRASFVCGMACVISGIVPAAVLAQPQEQDKKQAETPKLANEIVMVPGMEITAKTELGKITIVAGPGLRRTYRWEGCEGTVEMWPRPKRWYGSLGIYFPGPGDHWKECGGITRAVVEEGWWHLDSIEAALNEIRRANEGRNSYNRNKTIIQYHIYNDDGLVVMWSKTPERKQLSVEVKQILIDGRKPTRMPGSHNDDISIRYHKLDVMAGDEGKRGGKN